MEKEFCTYKQSLALKELGFDEPCITYYFSDGTFNDAAEEDDTLYPGDPRFYFDTNSLLSQHDQTEIQYNSVTAPLFQQAFRWFREKYNLWCWIEKFDEKETYIYQIPAANLIKIQGYYKTHEEAELACLDKLIEICKNK
jgi:hypothetical protein